MLYNALRRPITNDGPNYSTSLKNSFTCFGGKKAGRMLTTAIITEENKETVAMLVNKIFTTNMH